jgi:hypothetical protein
VENIGMRKTIAPAAVSAMDQKVEWLNLGEMASVEVTSEDPAYSIERALECQNAGGWRAATAGEQRIGITFDAPTPVRRIQLRFIETTVERTQEFTLHWFGSNGESGLIVRQQWNFSPAGSTIETEDYRVNLEAVSKIELTIRPGLDVGRVATLDCWRIA